MRWRRRRVMRLRVTEPPTPRPTAKPTRGQSSASASTEARVNDMTRVPRVTRRPLRRVVVKSRRRRSRAGGGSTAGPPQAESRLRPLSRRAATMVRPARVRMRNRKPCVLARRRLFGWKVRLLTARVSEGRASSTRDGPGCEAIGQSTVRSARVPVKQAAADTPPAGKSARPGCGQPLVATCGALLASRSAGPSFSPDPRPCQQTGAAKARGRGADMA